MRVSYFALGLILIGALVFGAAYAGHPLSVLVIENNYTVDVPPAALTSNSQNGASAIPSSTSSSYPTVFATNGSVTISAIWIDANVLQMSNVFASGTGNVTVQISSSSGYSATEHMINNWTLKVAGNPRTYTYTEMFSAQASYKFTNPDPTQPNVIYSFTFTGSATYGNATFEYATFTTYGEFPLQTVQHLGHFYVAVSDSTPVEITNTAVKLYYNVTGSATSFRVWYVEDNGTTAPFTDAYIIYQYGSTNEQVVLSEPAFLDGYTAYTTPPITVPVPTTISIQGYVAASGMQGSPYQLMEFVTNTSGLTIPQAPVFSTQQYISFGIGAVLILIGAVWIFKK